MKLQIVKRHYLDIGFLNRTTSCLEARLVYKHTQKPNLYTVKLVEKEQIGVKEPFPVTKCQFPS